MAKIIKITVQVSSMPVNIMDTKAILLVIFALHRTVLSGYLSPQTSYRWILGSFEDIAIPRTGKVQLTITGENITDIVTTKHFTTGNISIDTEGGVGSNSVVFSYGVTPKDKGYFETYIYTEEEDSSYKSKVLRAGAKSAKQIEYIQFVYATKYNSSDTPRAESVVFSFDRQIHDCYGYSIWLNGNGSRQVGGGFPQDRVDIVLDIPKGVSGNSYYECDYSSNEMNSRRTVVPFPVSQGPREGTGLVQIYGTTDHSNTTIGGSLDYNFDYEIVSYEGSIQWKNGTGSFIVYGGIGFKSITFLYDLTPHSYGILEYDVVVKLGTELV